MPNAHCQLAWKSASSAFIRPRTDAFLAKCAHYRHYVESYLGAMNLQNPYFRVLDPCAHTVVGKSRRTLVMLGSNNYLGLATHPAVVKAAKKAIDIYGTGCCSSRPLAGTTSLHVELEEELADFKGTEACLLFSTGYMTMLGALYGLVGEDDMIFSDQLNHASLIDGAKLAKARICVYGHNDMAHLEQLLAESDPEANKLIMTDAVFSMKGDLADLPQIKALADAYGAWVMIDDAHGTGVMGENGRGLAEHFGLEGEIDLVGCTFSKVFGTVGGAIAGRREVIDFLKFNSRPFVFTASLPPSVVATALAALRVIRSSPHLLRDLRKNAQTLKDGLTALGYPVMNTPTPIIPLALGNDEKVFRLAWGLEEEGVFVNPIVPPAVSSESSLIRVTAMATHSDDELEFALDKFALVGRRLGLI